MSNLQNIKFYYTKQSFRTPVRTALVELSIRSSLYVSAEFEGQLLFSECSAFETAWYEEETWPQVYRQLKHYKTQLEQININDEWYCQLCQLLSLQHARDTMDYLMWQAFAITQQQSLVQLLSSTSTISCGITVNTNDKQSFQQLLPTIQQYPRVKLKWHRDIMTFIQQLPTNMMIVIDANGQLTSDDFPCLAQLSKYDITYIEEPFKTIDLYEKFKKSGIELPVAIDESATSLSAIQSFIDYNLADIVCLKHGRLGGLSAIRQFLHQLKVPSFSGGMYEVNHAQYVTALVQSMLIDAYPADLFQRYFVEHCQSSVCGEYNLHQPITMQYEQLIEL